MLKPSFQSLILVPLPPLSGCLAFRTIFVVALFGSTQLSLVCNCWRITADFLNFFLAV